MLLEFNADPNKPDAVDKHNIENFFILEIKYISTFRSEQR